MKLSGFALIAPLLVLAFANGCSSGDDDDGAAGAAGTAGSGTSGSSTSGSSGTGGSTGGGAGTGGSTGGGAGTGGGTAGTGGSSAGTGATDSPSDTTQAGIDAFLDAMSYKSADWVADNSMPHASDDHGSVRSWYNKTLRVSEAAGETMRDTGSMVVKEILDDAAAVVGHAVLLRTATGWIYYCSSDVNGRCFGGHTSGMTIYGTSATATNCACHGNGTITTTVPPP